jgi:hypothetical protein
LNLRKLDLPQARMILLLADFTLPIQDIWQTPLLIQRLLLRPVLEQLLAEQFTFTDTERVND